MYVIIISRRVVDFFSLPTFKATLHVIDLSKFLIVLIDIVFSVSLEPLCLSLFVFAVASVYLFLR